MKTKYYILLTALFIISCNNETIEEINKPVPVKVEKVTLSEVRLPIFRSGVLSASTEARLSFKTGGIIRSIYTDEGDHVKKGQILASLDLSEIQAQVNLAKSGYEKSLRDLSRVEKLYRDSVATLEQMQDLNTACDVAQAKLNIAKFNLRHSKITAPANGRILKRFAEENETIAPGAPVFYFGSSQENWIIRIGVTDRDIVKLQIGDSASVEFDAHTNMAFPAYITEISESADPLSGTFEIELTLDNEKQKLVSGFVAKAAIFPAKTQKQMLLPLAALVEADGSNGYVYAVNDSSGNPDRVLVSLGPVINNKVIILSGISPGIRIITEGSAYLSEQSLIKIVD